MVPPGPRGSLGSGSPWPHPMQRPPLRGTLTLTRGCGPGLVFPSRTLSAEKKNLQNMNHELKTQAERSRAINNSELWTHESAARSSLRTVSPPATGQGRRRPAHWLGGKGAAGTSQRPGGGAGVDRNAAGLNCKVVWFDASPGDFLTGCKGFHAAAEPLGDQVRLPPKLALKGLVVQLDTPTCVSGHCPRSCFCHYPRKLGIMTLPCLQAKVDPDREPAYLVIPVGGHPCWTRTPEGSSRV